MYADSSPAGNRDVRPQLFQMDTIVMLLMMMVMLMAFLNDDDGDDGDDNYGDGNLGLF